MFAEVLVIGNEVESGLVKSQRMFPEACDIESELVGSERSCSPESAVRMGADLLQLISSIFMASLPTVLEASSSFCRR